MEGTMAKRIHPELRPHLPPPRTAFQIVVILLALIGMVVVVIGQSDDPVGALYHLPHAFLVTISDWHWMPMLGMSLAITAYSLLVRYPDYQTKRLLIQATQALDHAMPFSSDCVIWHDLHGRCARLITPATSTQGHSWKLSLSLFPDGIYHRANEPVHVQGEIYQLDDPAIPVVIRTPNGPLVADRQEEQLYMRWQTLSPAPRAIPFAVRLMLYSGPLISGLFGTIIVTLFIAMLATCIRGIVHHEIDNIIGGALSVVVFGPLALLFCGLIVWGVREIRVSIHLLRHGRLGIATGHNPVFLRRRAWMKAPEYAVHYTIATDGETHQRQVTVMSSAPDEEGAAAKAVLVDPESEQIAFISRAIKPYYIVPDARGNVRPNFFAATLILLMTAVFFGMTLSLIDACITTPPWR